MWPHSRAPEVGARRGRGCRLKMEKWQGAKDSWDSLPTNPLTKTKIKKDYFFFSPTQQGQVGPLLRLKQKPNPESVIFGCISSHTMHCGRTSYITGSVSERLIPHTPTIYKTLAARTREIWKKRETASHLLGRFITNCYSVYTKILSNSMKKECKKKILDWLG